MPRKPPDRSKQAAANAARRRRTLEQNLSAIGREMESLDARREELLTARDPLVVELRSAGVPWNALAGLSRTTRQALLKRTPAREMPGDPLF